MSFRSDPAKDESLEALEAKVLTDIARRMKERIWAYPRCHLEIQRDVKVDKQQLFALERRKRILNRIEQEANLERQKSISATVRRSSTLKKRLGSKAALIGSTTHFKSLPTLLSTAFDVACMAEMKGSVSYSELCGLRVLHAAITDITGAAVPGWQRLSQLPILELSSSINAASYFARVVDEDGADPLETLKSQLERGDAATGEEVPIPCRLLRAANSALVRVAESRIGEHYAATLFVDRGANRWQTSPRIAVGYSSRRSLPLAAHVAKVIVALMRIRHSINEAITSSDGVLWGSELLHSSALWGTTAETSSPAPSQPVDVHALHKLLNGYNSTPTEGGGATVRLNRDSTHIVVLRNGHMYGLEVLCAHTDTGEGASAEPRLRHEYELIPAIDTLLSQSAAPVALPFPLLSSCLLGDDASCSHWFEARKELFALDHHVAMLNLLESALFVLCVDDKKNPLPLPVYKANVEMGKPVPFDPFSSIVQTTTNSTSKGAQPSDGPSVARIEFDSANRWFMNALNVSLGPSGDGYLIAPAFLSTVDSLATLSCMLSAVTTGPTNLCEAAAEGAVWAAMESFQRISKVPGTVCASIGFSDLLTHVDQLQSKPLDGTSSAQSPETSSCQESILESFNAALRALKAHSPVGSAGYRGRVLSLLQLFTRIDREDDSNVQVENPFYTPQAVPKAPTDGKPEEEDDDEGDDSIPDGVIELSSLIPKLKAFYQKTRPWSEEECLSFAKSRVMNAYVPVALTAINFMAKSAPTSQNVTLGEAEGRTASALAMRIYEMDRAASGFISRSLSPHSAQVLRCLFLSRKRRMLLTTLMAPMSTVAPSSGDSPSEPFQPFEISRAYLLLSFHIAMCHLSVKHSIATRQDGQGVLTLPAHAEAVAGNTRWVKGSVQDELCPISSPQTQLLCALLLEQTISNAEQARRSLIRCITEIIGDLRATESHGSCCTHLAAMDCAATAHAKVNLSSIRHPSIQRLLSPDLITMLVPSHRDALTETLRFACSAPIGTVTRTAAASPHQTMLVYELHRTPQAEGGATQVEDWERLPYLFSMSFQSPCKLYATHFLQCLEQTWLSFEKIM